MHVAEQIQANIFALQLVHEDSRVSEYVTLSLGVASLMPTPEAEPKFLVTMADQALYQAKADGRDRIYMLGY